MEVCSEVEEAVAGAGMAEYAHAQAAILVPALKA
jgi:hypothetical protein